MRGLIVVLALLMMAPAVNAQSVGFPLVPAALNASTNSVIDTNGNLLIFDVFYSYPSPIPPPSTDSPRPVFLPTTTTRVTVITGDGRSKKSFEFDGSFQVAGVGRRAVYATVTTSVATPTPTIAGPAVSAGNSGTTAVAGAIAVRISVTQKLVALNVLAGALPSTLPSVASVSGEVKVAAVGSDGAPDSIAVIEPQIGNSPNPLAGLLNGLLSRVGAHSVRLFTFDGGSFKEVNSEPMLVP